MCVSGEPRAGVMHHLSRVSSREGFGGAGLAKGDP